MTESAAMLKELQRKKRAKELRQASSSKSEEKYSSELASTSQTKQTRTEPSTTGSTWCCCDCQDLFRTCCGRISDAMEPAVTETTTHASGKMIEVIDSTSICSKRFCNSGRKVWKSSLTGIEKCCREWPKICRQLKGCCDDVETGNPKEDVCGGKESKREAKTQKNATADETGQKKKKNDTVQPRTSNESKSFTLPLSGYGNARRRRRQASRGEFSTASAGGALDAMALLNQDANRMLDENTATADSSLMLLFGTQVSLQDNLFSPHKPYDESAISFGNTSFGHMSFNNADSDNESSHHLLEETLSDWGSPVRSPTSSVRQCVHRLELASEQKRENGEFMKPRPKCWRCEAAEKQRLKIILEEYQIEEPGVTMKELRKRTPKIIGVKKTCHPQPMVCLGCRVDHNTNLRQRASEKLIEFVPMCRKCFVKHKQAMDML